MDGSGIQNQSENLKRLYKDNYTCNWKGPLPPLYMAF